MRNLLPFPARLCYHVEMTDNSKGRPPRKPGGGGPRKPVGSGPRKPTGDKSGAGSGFRDRDPVRAGDAPLRRRPGPGWNPLDSGALDSGPRQPVNDGDIVPAPRPDFERKPFRPKGEGERPGRPPFRAREGGEERSMRPREGEKIYSPRLPKPQRQSRGPSRGPASTQRTVERAEGEERIAKVMARAGLCSRRDAESWIEAGRVAVNGEAITSPALNVGRGDQIKVDGKPLPGRERTRLWLFHKPRGLVTTQNDPEGRSTIFEALPDELPRVVSIGRLDINTEGLLLLTNDGGLSRMLELPATGWLRRYRVRAHGDTSQAKLDALLGGVSIDGVDYAGIEARMDRTQGANVWLTMGLREGKNREIKKVLEHLGLEVNRLIRLSFGPFQLGELAEGGVEEIKTRILMDQLGPQLIADAGADFDAPVFDHARGEPEPALAPAPRKFSERARRDGPEDAPEAAPERMPGGKRKHISILRAEERAAESGVRKRVERAETADRNGRTVRVERVVPVRQKKRGQSKSRNAEHFRKQRGERPPHSKPRLETRLDAVERDTRRGPSRPGGERTFKPRESGLRPTGERAPSREGAEPRAFVRRERPDGEPRAPREGGERAFKPREGGDRKFAERAPRRDSAERRDSGEPRAFVRRERPEGAPPPRAERADGGARKFRPREGNERPRPPRRDGGGGYRGKPGGSGKPGGASPSGNGPRGPRGPGGSGGPGGRPPRRDA